MASDYPGVNQVTLPGTNQLLPAGKSSFIPVTERSNRVQEGALELLGTHSELGRPTKANPLGAQNG